MKRKLFPNQHTKTERDYCKRTKLNPSCDYVLHTETKDIDIYTCIQCNGRRLYDYSNAILSCEECGLSIIYQENSETKQFMNGSEPSVTVYDRVMLYKKHIEQYTNAKVTIPETVIDEVRRLLFNVKINSSSKCKAPLISKMLKENKLGKWSKHSVHISRLVTHGTKEMLSPSIIEKLVRRFDILNRYHREDLTQKCKFMNFDFVTKQLLYMEGYSEIAKLFPTHKTADVEGRAQNRLSVICKKVLAERQDGDTNWFVTRTSHHVFRR